MDDNEVTTLSFTLIISRELNMGCRGLHHLGSEDVRNETLHSKSIEPCMSMSGRPILETHEVVRIFLTTVPLMYIYMVCWLSNVCCSVMSPLV
jgi:hypothetical protein